MVDGSPRPGRRVRDVRPAAHGAEQQATPARRCSAPARLCSQPDRPISRHRVDGTVRPRASSVFRFYSADDSKLWKHPRRSRQALASRAAVVIHLAYERVQAVELQFLAEESDEGDVEAAAINVALEVEQEDFQQRRAIVEGRTPAKTRDPVEAPVAQADAHRIDAVLEAAILVEPDIGGRVAEVATAVLAMEDFAVNEPRAAQHRGRLFDLPFGQRHPDRA